MLFNSVDFIIFLPIVLTIYYIVPKKVKHIWLLIASYYFYMCWNIKYVILIFASTVITYISGLLLETAKASNENVMVKEKQKKAVVAFSFIANISILFYFKYINFTLDAISRVFSTIHITLNVPVFDVLLPVGISFYTFQALSYTMDVYREEISAEKHFFRYALFVSFFPQLVAGPIERSKKLIVQLRKPKKFNLDKAFEGLLLMLWGFFLKIVMADRIALFVDTIYGNHDDYQGMYFVVATMLFAIQIYCDFAGYSTIAMGTAELFGIDLMENFDAPYLSSTVSEFWRRWHISLTSWFKDYLYIPLGGSRKGKLRKYVNKMVVFLVSGLWHGAQFTFVVWGGLNGLYQVVGEILMPIRRKITDLCDINKQAEGYKIISGIVTFILIDFSWIFFRSDSLATASQIISSIFETDNLWILFDGSLYECGLDEKNYRFMIYTIILLFVVDLLKCYGIEIRMIIQKQDYWFKCLFFFGSILVLLIFGKYGPAYDAANFIYFQF